MNNNNLEKREIGRERSDHIGGQHGKKSDPSRNRKKFIQRVDDNLRSLNLPDGSKVRTVLTIGDGTTINGPITVKGGAPCDIGKYCAIGDGVRIITSNHNPNIVNLHAGLQKEVVGYTGHTSKGRVVVGHNVWIGDAVIILPGVSVGNGAIIGAGAVVTRCVKPYEIVVGNPAIVIRTRFQPEVIEFLEILKWWDWSIELMKKNACLFEPDAMLSSVKELQGKLHLP